MSCIYKGTIIETEQSISANGGTEQMRRRLLNLMPRELLSNVAIHFSRPRNLYPDVKHIFYAHDLPVDHENDIFLNGGWNKFDMFVFVSRWQREMYINKFNIPYSKCTVIENAIEPAKSKYKTFDKIKMIYHTTPHRGLELLYPVFDLLTKEYSNLHLDVFSSFELYGWKHRDNIYEPLFKKLKNHPCITYHGAVSNDIVRNYLEQAHYFPYPCIWKETSCIALIEAIEHNVIAIHPDYGALAETAVDNTMMYDYNEHINIHATQFYAMIKVALDSKAHENVKIVSNPKHSIEFFKLKWKQLLEDMSNAR